MRTQDVPVQWAARVRREKVQRLYESDAQGLLDERLLDEVGYALYSRCRSVLTASEALMGRVACPQCETLILRSGDEVDALLRCPACGWASTWGAYHKTIQHHELFALGAAPMLHVFVTGWEQTNTPQAKMLLIDGLIHTWHWQERSDHMLGRPTAVNLIEGSRKQVLALLDTLAARA